jgi:FMN phosphatase YigB (HAD superfamily)
MSIYNSNLLLDFDGVVVRNERIGAIVKDRSESFIAKKYNLTKSQSARVNRVFYKTHGHTAIGVDPENYKQHVLEYNDYVFSNLDYSLLRAYITPTDVRSLRNVVSHKKRYGLFTNAPISWCENMCALAHIDLYDFIDPSSCFTSDEGLIKPKKEIYDHVEESLENNIYFIDDSAINLEAVGDRDRWSTTLLGPDEDLSSRLIDLSV